MRRRELNAAGITDPALRASYLYCRLLHARHGRTYFLATRLLRPAQRAAVHALYGFARWVDDLVDDAPDPSARGRQLAAIEAELGPALATRSTHPVLAALGDTVRRHRIDPRHFTDFMASMRMDLEVTDYPDLAALGRYMHGSAAVIGLQLLPVLGARCPQEEAEPYAAALGVAFQFTNFLRDVGEDLDRGRVYLPADELRRFGVDRELLTWCRRTGRADERVRRLVAHLVELAHDMYRSAAPGVPLLSEVSQVCVGTAFTLYRGILDEIARGDHDVLRRRARVPAARRLAVALPAAARAIVLRSSSPGHVA